MILQYINTIAILCLIWNEIRRQKAEKHHAEQMITLHRIQAEATLQVARELQKANEIPE